jgi:hypothetical protein
LSRQGPSLGMVVTTTTNEMGVRAGRARLG